MTELRGFRAGTLGCEFNPILKRVSAVYMYTPNSLLMIYGSLLQSVKTDSKVPICVPPEQTSKIAETNHGLKMPVFLH